jgi:tetratricopeptide (TPR) repeat protein
MWKAGVVLAAAFALYQVSAGASGGSMPAPVAPAGASMPSMTPEDMARAAYNSGIEHKDKGLKLEQKAAADQAKDQQKNLAKAKNEFEKSLKDFKKAADIVPSLPQAYNGMGFAYRKLGDYATALEMYNKALQLAPDFADALEYRGEAYLGLNRLDDAKQAYLQLFASDRKQADILMKSMSEWVTKRQADPAGVDPSAVAAFESWLKERSTLAGQTTQMALSVPHESWR